MERRGFYYNLLFLLIISIYILLGSSIFAAEPSPPTQLEQNDFNAKLGRINNNRTNNPNFFHRKVDDVIESLTETVTRSFVCPKGSKVALVNINITTKHIQWDLDLTINGKNTKLKNNAGKVGCYIWNASVTNLVPDDVKEITATNYIMLDPKVTGPQESTPPFGPIADEGLLYHELLHGQLLIDAMTNDVGWQQKVCNCNFDLGPADNGEPHTTIPVLEESYIAKIAGATTSVYTVRPPAKPAKDADGNFEVEIADESMLGNKNPWSWNSYFPNNSNVKEDTLNVEIKNGKIVVTGKLIDKTKPGFFLVHIDPPSIVIFAGIETGIVILPGPDFGDAPDPFTGTGQYPSLLVNNGARHLDYTMEWLGDSVDGESNSKQVNADLYDDGVVFNGPMEPGTPVVLNVMINTSGGVGKYVSGDNAKRLYLHAWFDWNGDGDWDDVDEYAIFWAGGPTFDDNTTQPSGISTWNSSAAWGTNGKVLAFNITPPAGMTDNKPFYSRFRLDYGENITTVTGEAQYGEVEDYRHEIYTLISLTSFTATGLDDKVVLNWVTASELDNADFNILRSTSSSGSFVRINSAMISAMGSPTSGATYSFVDTNVENGKTYYYQLEDIDNRGTKTIHNTISATPMVAGTSPTTGGDTSQASTPLGATETSSTSIQSTQSPSSQTSTPSGFFQMMEDSGNTLSVSMLEAPRQEDTINKEGITPKSFSLKAVSGDGQIAIEWAVTDPNDSFYILRSEEEDGVYLQINVSMISSSVEEEETKSVKYTYTYTDTTVLNGTTYYYKLERITTEDKSTFIGPIHATPRVVLGQVGPE